MENNNDKPLELKKLDPKYVVDQLMGCFINANKEVSKAMNEKVSDEELEARTKIFLGDAFRKCNVSMENPTKEGILKAMDECRANILNTMGEKEGSEFVNKYYVEMKDLVDKMDDKKSEDK